MKYFTAFLVLLLFAPALATSQSDVEATTAITLPVDSVTIYPDGLMAVKRMGSLDVTDGVHKFVVNVPKEADASSLLSDGQQCDSGECGLRSGSHLHPEHLVTRIAEL